MPCVPEWRVAVAHVASARTDAYSVSEGAAARDHEIVVAYREPLHCAWEQWEQAAEAVLPHAEPLQVRGAYIPAGEPVVSAAGVVEQCVYRRVREALGDHRER